MTDLLVKDHQFTQVEDKLRRALFETSLLAPSLDNLSNAKREITEALRMMQHMRRIAEKTVVIPFFNSAEQRDALGQHVRAERARVVNPGSA